jgi:tetratricopeptide (TPR) repeat protein
LLKGAHEALDAVAALPGAIDRERADYLRVWVREAERDLTALAREGLSFLDNWQASTRCPEVTMKVAEAFYRMEDFSNAQAHFVRAAEKYPDSPYTEAALFFAGKAAMSLNTKQSLNEAISRWQEVVQMKQGLSFAARFHQALAKRLQGLNLEAVNALDDLLEDKTLGETQRRSVLFEKAELLISLGAEEPERLKQAEELLRPLVKGGKTYEWRARASVLLASVYQAAKRSAEALDAAYDAVLSLPADPTEPPSLAEHQWHGRAGFMALDLLEKNQQWEAAAKLAEKIATAKGPRAQEAAERANRIRLEHFLWDGGKK